MTERRHVKRSLLSWVIIISKEEWTHMAATILFLVWHWLLRFFFFFSLFFLSFSFFFEKSVSYQKNDERGQRAHTIHARNAFQWSEVKVTWVKVKVRRVRGIGQSQPGNSSQGQGHMSRLQDQTQKLYVEVSAWLDRWNVTIFIIKRGFLSKFCYIFCTRNAQ